MSAATNIVGIAYPEPRFVVDACRGRRTARILPREWSVFTDDVGG